MVFLLLYVSIYLVQWVLLVMSEYLEDNGLCSDVFQERVCDRYGDLKNNQTLILDH